MDTLMDLAFEPNETVCKAVLKLDLGTNGTRRIPYKDLLDPTTLKLSYDRLVEHAVRHSHVEQKNLETNKQQDFTVITSYTDEDGDEIRINTDEELADAFRQFKDQTPPVLRAKAEVTCTPRKCQKNAMCNKGLKSSSSSPLPSHPKCKWQVKGSSIVPPSTCGKPQGRPFGCGRPGPGRGRGPTKTKPNAAADTNTKACPKSSTKDQDIDPNFIHGRHTCDGCLVTPIIGLRYHATNLPDYDLCSKCFGNYEGSMEFKLDQKAPDQFKQKRWNRRYSRNTTTPMVFQTGLPPTACKRSHWEKQTRRVNFRSNEDDDVQEAIRRSLHGAVNTVNAVSAAFAARNNDNGARSSGAPGSSGSNHSNTEEGINVPKFMVEVDAGIKDALRFANNTVIDIEQDVKDAIQRAMEQNGRAVDMVLEMAHAPTSAPPRQEEVPMQTDDSNDANVNLDMNDADLNEAILRSLNETSVKKTEPEVDEATTDLLVQEAIRLSFNNQEQEDSAAAAAAATATATTTTEPVFAVAVEEDIVVTPTPQPKESESASIPSGTQETEEALSEDMEEDKNEDEENNTTIPVALVVEEEDVDSAASSEGELVEGDDHDDADELSDEWDVVADDEMIADAASKLGSALHISDSSR